MSVTDFSSDPKTVITAASALIALVAAGVAIYSNWRSRRLSELSVRIAEFNAAQAHRKAIFDWSSSCQDVLSEAYCFFAIAGGKGPGSENLIHALMAKLNSLIDKGRWLLPNDKHDKYGTNKEAAYTGIRQLPLDCLVAAFDTLNKEQSLRMGAGRSQSKRPATEAENLNEGNDPSQRLLIIKREFTSSIQERLEPRVVDREIAKIKLGSKS